MRVGEEVAAEKKGARWVGVWKAARGGGDLQGKAKGEEREN